MGIIGFIIAIKKPRMFQNSSAHSHTLVTKLKLGWQTQCWAQFCSNQHFLILGKLTGLVRKHRERCGRERNRKRRGKARARGAMPALMPLHQLQPQPGPEAWLLCMEQEYWLASLGARSLSLGQPSGAATISEEEAEVCNCSTYLANHF